ncbi:MAG: hypothetical protein KAX98_14445, partial [Nitrospira sp.]|nr:hypothetical protein [Nitrospira sp.]
FDPADGHRFDLVLLRSPLSRAPSCTANLKERIIVNGASKSKSSLATGARFLKLRFGWQSGKPPV